MKNYWLYVLRLEQGKYYVGVTSKTPEVRMKQHISGFAGAAWTKKYKPLELIDKKDLGLTTYQEAQKYEGGVVRAYMEEHGINSTRGGDLNLTADLIERFGRYFDKENWQTITVIVFLLLVILVLAFR